MLIPSRTFGGKAFQSFGGILETSRIQPQIEEIKGAILNVADYVEDIAKPLLVARRVAIEDTQAHFDKEENPDGYGWYPLDDEYLASKTGKGYPPDILHRTGELEDAATSEAAWLITDDSLVFDFGALPEYGIYHQTGTNTDNVGEAADYRARVKSGVMAEGSSAHDGLGIGRGQALPQREFIGLSERAELLIAEGFDIWFDETEKVYVSKLGVMQRRVGGQFGSKVLVL